MTQGSGQPPNNKQGEFVLVGYHNEDSYAATDASAKNEAGYEVSPLATKAGITSGKNVSTLSAEKNSMEELFANNVFMSDNEDDKIAITAVESQGAASQLSSANYVFLANSSMVARVISKKS